MSTNREFPDDDRARTDTGLPVVPTARAVDAGRHMADDLSLQADPVRVVTAGVGLARLTVGATARLGRWGLGASMRIGNRVIKAAVAGETATSLLDDATEALREQARDLLGIVDDAGRVVGLQMPREQHRALPDRSADDLQAKGAALLEASADVTYDEPYHPAYARILDQMAPDEARILRLMELEGPQAIVDVRTSSPIPGASELIESDLNMVGAEAGCRYLDRVPAYLNNLQRLGLIAHSTDQVEDHSRYQVLEAQPDVLAALRSHSRTKTIRKSLRVTPFGTDFARTCLLGRGGTIDDPVIG